MNTYLASAAALAFLVGLVHSVLGESMIFGRMREGKFIPTNGGRVIGEGHVRILWASWHVLTVFGWLVAATLLWLATQPVPPAAREQFCAAVAVAMLVGAVLVFVGTKARHPGWLGLLGVGILAWLGRSS